MASSILSILLFAAWLFIVYSRRFRPLARFVFLGLLFLIFTDTGYIAYFNSFYSEPSSFIFLFCMLALLLLTLESPHTGTLLGCAFCCLFFVTAKPQNAPLGILLAVIFLRLRDLRPGRLWHWTTALLSLIVAAVSVTYSVSNPKFSYKTTYFTAVFSELLKYSPDIHEDLAELGVNNDLARYAGASPFDQSVPQLSSPEFQTFFDRMSFTKIGIFYLHHLGRLQESLDRTAQSALLVRPDFHGNFDKSAGLPPYQKSHAFSFWSGWKSKYAPKTILSFEVLGGMEALGIVILYCRKRTRTERILLELLALLIAMAALQILTVTVTMGTIDPIKQMFLFSVLCDISFVITVVWGVGRLSEWIARFPRDKGSFLRALRAVKLPRRARIMTGFHASGSPNCSDPLV